MKMKKKMFLGRTVQDTPVFDTCERDHYWRLVKTMKNPLSVVISRFFAGGTHTRQKSNPDHGAPPFELHIGAQTYATISFSPLNEISRTLWCQKR